MVSEGVDIPRLRVGVYATAAKTPLVFRQIVGRFVRTTRVARRAEWLYIPADPVLRDHAASVEQELRRALRAQGRGGRLTSPISSGAAAADRGERGTRIRAAECRRRPPDDPVRIAGGRAATRADRGPPWRHRSRFPARRNRPDPAMPAFERRAMLRGETGTYPRWTRRERSHREIKAAEPQTRHQQRGSGDVEGLERSVELLAGSPARGADVSYRRTIVAYLAEIKSP